MTIEELKQFAVELGEAPFRGKQLFRWIHKGERVFSAMTDFSEKLREKLQEAAFIGGVQVEKIQQDTSLPLQQRRDQTYGYWIASISRRTGKIEEYPYRAVTSGCPGTIL